MKNKFILLMSIFCSSQLFSQCLTSDSTVMGPGYANDVFYSCKNGTVKTVSNNNWHMAFSVQGSQFPTHSETGVSIRVNSVKGNVLVKLPNANATNWRKIDTTGLYSMRERLDSFKTWDMSAFTREYNISTSPFNFIWGTYNNITHNVEGTNVFILYNKTAGIYKKVFVKSLGFDTLWNVIISNIDNSDSTNLIFGKGQYPNRLFVYYDMVNKQLINREPAKSTWDIVWTRYKDIVTQNSVTLPYPLTGILANKDVTIAKNLGKKCNEVWVGNVTAPYVSQTDIIGWDWKVAPQGPGPFTLVDTFIYFIKAQDGKTYKMAFNGFTGSASGKTYLSGREVSASLNNIDANNFTVYPNPANGIVKINTTAAILNVALIDINGAKTTLNAINNSVDLSSFAAGIYILNIQTSNGVISQKLIKE